MTPVLDVRGLAKRYGDERVFEHVDLQVQRGEFVAVLGESGVGKSTLLNCIAGLDVPDAGEVHVLGLNVTRASETEQAQLRRRHVGFVFQAFHVLPHLTVAQNVSLPLLLLGTPDDARVEQALAAVGLAGLGPRLPQQLSGGQLQRVAIARALIHRPALLLADEPSGNLDPATAGQVMGALMEQVRGQGAACVLVTHSRGAAAMADRVVRLTAGGVVDAAA
jgi:putative ABC transport system ATP-binding protein